jgi:hypothetical protein
MNSTCPIPNAVVAVPFATRLAHLDLDLGAQERPALVSSLLQTSLETSEGEALDWQQVHATDIARRLQWLLTLCRCSGIDKIELQAPCPSCGTDMSLELDLAQLARPQPSPEFDCEPEPGVRLRLRVPTGRDQSCWAAAGRADPGQLLADLVVSLEKEETATAVGDFARQAPLPDRWLPTIEEALEAADPLTAMSIQTSCPACHHALELPVDLEQSLLHRLMAEQARVLSDIHRLASTYHWSEQQILALSPARRRFYLDRIAQTRGAL